MTSWTGISGICLRLENAEGAILERRATISDGSGDIAEVSADSASEDAIDSRRASVQARCYQLDTVLSSYVGTVTLEDTINWT